MFDQINKYKASFGRLFEAKTLKVMLEIALLTILLSFLGPIKNMIYTEVVNKLSLGITVKLGIIMFASYIVVQVIEECVSYFQLAGTLIGSYLANRKSTALIAYRLEQLEQKVSKHNNLVERTYALEESVALLEEGNCALSPISKRRSLRP